MIIETQTPKRPHILFLFSATGGGHRSAAEAIIEAVHLEYGEQITTEMVDILKDYGPPPLNWMPELYPTMVRAPRAWAFGFHLSNGNRQVKLIIDSFIPYVRKAIYTLAKEHPSDMIVSVHPLANWPILRILGNQRPPYITVVTDLVSVHAFWYSRLVDLCVVPTEIARQKALTCGLRPDQLQVVGLPVADRFCQPPENRFDLRARWGWPQDRPLILLVGGGEGMGPLERTARAIEASCPAVSLVIITGKNQVLKERLESLSWSIPTFMYGFVREMSDFMGAADILVTKAGPGTISEALIAGLPIILYSRLPGQEEGNVSYVVSEGAGIWAPRPRQIVSAINDWIEHPEKRAQAVAASLRLAKPQASRQIAHILAKRLGFNHD